MLLPPDPTYGYNLAQLLDISYPEGPADFDDFWRATYAEAREVPLRLTRKTLKSPDPRYDLFELKYDSFGGARIGAWLTFPRHAKPVRAIVVGHGYGGREAPEWELPGPPAAAIFPCARGFNLSAARGISNNSSKHVVAGIEQRETYMHRGCVADYWGAASAILELLPELAPTLQYSGTSFGGGMGALLLPWDNRFKRAYLDVPSFGNHPLRVTLPCSGSGEAVRLLHKKNPDIMRVVQYFDAATSASRISIPTFFACALSDPSVPPPGQFAVHNAVKAPKELFVRQTGHPDTPSDWPLLWPRLEQWFQVS